MKPKYLVGGVAAALLLVLITVCLVKHRVPDAPTRAADAAVTSRVSIAPLPVTAAPVVASAVSQGRALGERVARPVEEPPAEADAVREPQFVAFNDWLQRFRRADDLGKAALEAEGKLLAQARLTAFADLISADPQRALELALPSAARIGLPESIRSLLETPVNSLGDFAMLATIPFGAKGGVPAVFRTATIKGEEYQAFTFGDGLQFITSKDVPLNGYSAPASAATKLPINPLTRAEKLLALDQRPARKLAKPEIEELKKVKGADVVCSVSGKSWAEKQEETAAEIGGQILTFCGPAHLRLLEDQAIAASGLTTPGGAQDPLFPAKSSYTEGRKRMLLMRPYWTNQPVAMNTNASITHYANFSNYMWQMSYGKLVLAPLGKGSTITPDMLIPGNVNSYIAGLGGATNDAWRAVRDVAQTNYGYNLSDYDFLYYVTTDEPAASYCGLGFVGGVGFHLANSCFDAAVSSHEFGHNLGLNHANFWDTGMRNIAGAGQNDEYGDNNDPMGGGGNPNQYNSRYKNYLGWITNSDIAVIPASGSNRYRLYCFDLDYSVGLRGLRFTYSASRNYWVQFRQRKTASSPLMNGVQLMWTGNGNESSHVLDVRLKGNATDNAIAIGRTYSDTNLNFHITPIGKGNTYPESIDVVAVTGPQPGNLPPVVTVSATTLNPGVGQSVTFSATASDPNGDALAYYWEFGDSVNNFSVNNQPTQVKSFGTAGEYAVRCVVSDMRGGTDQRTLIVRVGNPNVFRISGHVTDERSRPFAGARITAGSRTVFTDSDGIYIIPGLAAGNYTVSAIEPVRGAFEFVHPFWNNPVTLGPNAEHIDFVVGTNAPPITLVATGALWRYLDKGTDQGTAWIAPAFSDITWSNGPSQLGYGENDESTRIEDNATPGYNAPDVNRYITYYFRHSFNVTNAGSLTNLVLNVLRDDGVIVYLNGTQIFRDNMPTGAVTYLTPASGSASDDGQTWLLTNVPPSLLLPGTNVIAAEVHQESPSSSDVTFNLFLTAENMTNEQRATIVYVDSPADDAAFTSPTNITISASAYSAPNAVTNVDIFDGATMLASVASPPYTAALNSPSDGLHVLRAISTDATGLRRTSGPVNITVSAPVPRGCTLVAPAEGTNVGLPGSVTLTAQAVAGGSLSVTNVRFYADGLSIGQAAAAPYTFTWNNPLSGAHVLYAIANDSVGASITSAPVNITVSAVLGGDALISFGDMWKYLDDGQDAGTSWRTPAFNDNQWMVGAAQLGYGDGDEQTIVSFGTNANFKYVTTYFRKKFVVGNPAAFGGLLLRLIRDDGVVVYLNGTEVFRNNLLAGPVSYNSLAQSAIGGVDESTPIEALLSTVGLLPGTNTIAVEVHQDSITSSDLSFDLALTGLRSTNITDGIYITSPGNNTHYNMPGTVALSSYAASTGGAITLVEYFDGITKVGQSISFPYSATWIGPSAGTHILTAVATYGAGLQMTSPPLSIVVGPAPPPIAPVFTQFINWGAQWKYWDSATPVSIGWQAMGFDDAAWPVGNARLGWGIDGEATLLTAGRVTHYFRTAFVVNNGSMLDSLTFNVVRDDGVVVYMNGVEVFRTNMPAGPVSGSTLAVDTVNTPDETIPVVYTLSTSILGPQQGTNIVAVELHQSSATSSDAGFDLSLYGEGTTEARIYLASPQNNSKHVTGLPLPLEAQAQVGTGRTVTAVEFFANGTNIAQVGTPPYRTTWPSAPAGSHTIFARAVDNLGISITSAPVQISVGHATVSLVLVPADSVWKFLDNGSDQGTNWAQTNFNDVTWASGAAELGYGDLPDLRPETTVLCCSNAAQKFITYYFRRQFVVPPETFITNLTFRLVRDDGALVWLNGREMYRSNMPPGAVTYLTPASAAVNGTSEATFYVTTLSTTNVYPGTNLMAVEIHQNNTTSSDISFNLQVEGDGYVIGTTAPGLIASESGGQFRVAWPANAIGYQLYRSLELGPGASWQPVGGAPTVTNGFNVILIPPTNPAAFYRLQK